MLDKSQVQKAVTALLTLVKKTESTTNIVDQPEKIDLQLALKVIPKVKHKAIKLELPASVHYDAREVCLFVKDLDKKDREYEKTVQHYEDLFRQKGISNISKIVPMKALRTDYSMPSNKRSLAKAYELYLADGTIFGMLPGTLGKIFFDKKKTWPVQVNLRAQDLKKELDNVVNNSRCIIDGKGSSCMAMVAHDRMSEEEIVSNIVAAANQLAEKLPGGEANIRNLHIKCSSTIAVPIYVDFGNPGEVEMPEFKKKPVEVAVQDITTVTGGPVYVRADGVVSVVRKKTKREADSDGKGLKKKKKLDIKEEPADENENTDDKKDIGALVKDTLVKGRKKPRKRKDKKDKKGSKSKERYFEKKQSTKKKSQKVIK